MNHSFRILALGGLVVASVAAQAATIVFDFSTAGTFGISGSTVSVSDPVMLDDSSTVAVSSLSYTYDVSGTPGSGTITLANSDTIDFTFTGTVTPTSAHSNALGAAVVSFQNGTGSLAGYTGSGSISNTTSWTNDPSVGRDYSTFYGEIEAVPEPASMAALALGIAGIARRRRSK